jgi:hypothetical protein
MKVLKSLFSYLIVLLTIITSCTKDDETNYTTPPSDYRSTPPSYTAYVDTTREYHWAQSWAPTLKGQEIQISSSRLTKAAIDKSIVIYVAIYTEMTTFLPIPATIDSIELSYVAEPGHLYVIAKTARVLNFESDVYIQF